MGLFWSIKAIKNAKSQRFIKKDVTTPMLFTIRAFIGDHVQNRDISETPFSEIVVERLFMKPGVKRIPLTTGVVRGTVFIPEGLL